MVVHKWKAYGHATPDEPLRRAPEWTTQWKIYFSCRRGFMVEYLSWNSSIALNAIKKSVKWNPHLSLFCLYYKYYFSGLFTNAPANLSETQRRKKNEWWYSKRGNKEFEVLLKLVDKETFMKGRTDLILLFWSFRMNMETKAHKKKIKKKMPRREKKRRKVQTDDGVRNLFKLLLITSIVGRHAIRCLSQNVAWHINPVFNLSNVLVIKNNS